MSMHIYDFIFLKSCIWIIWKTIFCEQFSFLGNMKTKDFQSALIILMQMIKYMNKLKLYSFAFIM